MGTCIKRQQLLCNLPNISSLSLPVTALISLTPPPAPPISSLVFTKTVTSVCWAWPSVTNLFLPFERWKTLPASPQIRVRLQSPVELACAEKQHSRGPFHGISPVKSNIQYFEKS